MTGLYKISDGTKIRVFLWSDLLKGKTSRKDIEIQVFPNNSGFGKQYKKRVPLLKDDIKGLYFNWKGESVYLNEYFSYSYAELLHRVNELGVVDEDDILATFLRHSEDVCIRMELPTFDYVIPELGLGICGNKSMEVLCELSENRYKKCSWDYKIEVVPKEDYCVVSDRQYKKILKGKVDTIPKSEHLRKVVSSRSYYFSDFVRMIALGSVKLTTEEEYDVFLENERNKVKKKRFSFIEKMLKKESV